jgi:hypothetical protein
MQFHIRRVVLWLLVALVLTPALSAQGVDPLLKERVWTDQQGRKMRARFERIENGNLILSSGGSTTVVPLSQLSDADRDFLDNPNPAPAPPVKPAAPSQGPAPAISEPRPWTINGRQVIGGIKSADERGLVLQTAAGDFQLSYQVLVDDADALEASKYLNSIGRGDLAQRLADIFERSRGRAFPMPRQDQRAATDDASDVGNRAPVYESPDKVLEVDVPHPKGRATEFQTADKLLGPSPADTAKAKVEEDLFQRKVILGGLTLFVAIGAIITYGWWTSRGRQQVP